MLLINSLKSSVANTIKSNKTKPPQEEKRTFITHDQTWPRREFDPSTLLPWSTSGEVRAHTFSCSQFSMKINNACSLAGSAVLSSDFSDGYTQESAGRQLGSNFATLLMMSPQRSIQLLVCVSVCVCVWVCVCQVPPCVILSKQEWVELKYTDQVWLSPGNIILSVMLNYSWDNKCASVYTRLQTGLWEDLNMSHTHTPHLYSCTNTTIF